MQKQVRQVWTFFISGEGPSMGWAGSKNQETWRRSGWQPQSRCSIREVNDGYDDSDVNSFHVLFSNADTLTAEKPDKLKLCLKSIKDYPLVTVLSEIEPKSFRFEKTLAEYHIEG